MDFERKNYLNDAEFAFAFSQDKVKNKGIGPLALKSELFPFKLNAEMVENTVAKIYSDYSIDSLLESHLKKRKIITVAIDSPAAAGAGTQAKLISKHYNLYYLDTGKIYRFIGFLRLKNQKNFNYALVRRKIKKIQIKSLKNKNLLSDDVAVSASIVAKDKKIRNIVHQFQQKCAYYPPMKYAGSVLDGRDIITVQVKNAMFKFFITASLKERANRRFKEYKSLNKKITYKQVLKSLKNRDKSDKERKHGPLKKTKDSILINTTKLSKKACFKKIKVIMDNKLNS